MTKTPPSSQKRQAEASDNTNGTPLCPSAQPDSTGSVVFGVVGGTVEEPRLAYFTEPQPVTNELLELANPVKPTEVFRFAAPCVGNACKHFDGSDCRLAKRTVEMVPAVVEKLPPCRLRPRCRWWRQEGKSACMRCPMVVTDVRNPTEAQRRWADPDYNSRSEKENTADG